MSNSCCIEPLCCDMWSRRVLKRRVSARSSGSCVIAALNECGVGGARTRNKAIQQWERVSVGVEIEKREVAANRGSGELKKQRIKHRSRKSTRDESRRKRSRAQGNVGDGVVEAKWYTSQCEVEVGAA